MKRICLASALLLGCSGSDFSSAKAPGAAGMAGDTAVASSSGEGSGSSAGESPIGEAGSDSSGSGGTLTVRDRICAPGSTQDCAGPGRCPGAQACSNDGRSWGACECSAQGSGGSGSTGGDAGQAGSVPADGGHGGSSVSVGGSGGNDAAGTGGVATGGADGSLGGAGSGGSAGMVGSAGTGGAGGYSCDVSGWTVSNDGYVKVPAMNGQCWEGYAFGGGDRSSSIVFPGGRTDFSAAKGKLELSGTVGSATADNMYAGNVYLGFNLAQAVGSDSTGKVAPTGTGLTVICTGCSAPPMLIEINDGTNSWCATLTSSAAIPYASFAKRCLDTPTGAAYLKQPIGQIRILIPGSNVAQSFDVTMVSVFEN